MDSGQVGESAKFSDLDEDRSLARRTDSPTGLEEHVRSRLRLRRGLGIPNHFRVPLREVISSQEDHHGLCTLKA